MNLLNTFILIKWCLYVLYILGYCVKFCLEKIMLLTFLNCWSKESSELKEREGVMSSTLIN